MPIALDIAPTVLELLGVSRPEGIDGRPLDVGDEWRVAPRS
jgi:arylsulfatase A-like enzyme